MKHDKEEGVRVIPDKYSAVWVSHSSMGDFLKCPRLYFLNNVYKDPRTRRKISIINPHLALGQAVHNTIEALAEERVPAHKRMDDDLMDRFENEWTKISGKRGGFKSPLEEEEMKVRGRKMITHVQNNPGPLIRKALVLPAGNMPPHFYLSEEENIILCGKVDWLEYIPADDSVHIIDFKTGKNEENADSLQLPIYLLLTSRLQKRPVSRASYWYLDESTPDGLIEKDLPDIDTAFDRVFKEALRVKRAREAREFDCPRGSEGCFACQPFEKIIHGEAECVGINDINQDTYII